MLGFTGTADYPAVLAETMDIDIAKAGAVAQDVNDLLFTKIRDAMKRTYEKQKAVSATVSAPVAVKITTPPLPVAISKPIEPHPADLMLTQKTVTTAPTTPKPATPPAPPQAPKPATPPVTPQPYKADPYREPTN